jgi:hypothetical protein
VSEYVHEATVEIADGADPRALGGAITVARIVAALESGEQAGPDGRVSRWTVHDAAGT